jgi:hypothetical protein
MKKVVFLTIAVIALVSCQSNKKELEKEQVSEPKLALVETDSEFFNENGRKVTPETYPTDETSRQMLKNQALVGVNKFLHKRQLTPTNNQPVVRMNRDTYYSLAVVDVSHGATVTMPEVPEGKYISVLGVTEDHRIQAMNYGSGTFDLSTHTGDHLYLVIRLDATFTEEEAKVYQDQMSIAANSNKNYSALPVNKESFEVVENELKKKLPVIIQRDGASALVGMFTDINDESNELMVEEKYQIGAAVGWGGAQMKDNVYEISGNYPCNECFQLNFEDPKNKAFWSITVYDKNGFMFNDLANFSSNTATPNVDGTYTISFGCGKDAINNLETSNPTDYFNLAARHYQPSNKVLLDNYRLLPLLEKKSK